MDHAAKRRDGVVGRRTILHAASHNGGRKTELDILCGERNGFEAG